MSEVSFLLECVMTTFGCCRLFDEVCDSDKQLSNSTGLTTTLNDDIDRIENDDQSSNRQSEKNSWEPREYVNFEYI